jgi:hypothetical protein
VRWEGRFPSSHASHRVPHVPHLGCEVGRTEVAVPQGEAPLAPRAPPFCLACTRARESSLHHRAHRACAFSSRVFPATCRKGGAGGASRAKRCRIRLIHCPTFSTKVGQVGQVGVGRLTMQENRRQNCNSRVQFRQNASKVMPPKLGSFLRGDPPSGYAPPRTNSSL